MSRPRQRFCSEGHDTEAPRGKTKKDECRLCSNARRRAAYRNGWRATGRRHNASSPHVPISPFIDYLTRRGLSVNANFDANTVRLLQRAKHKGHLDYWIADELACSLDAHPIDIWPDWQGLGPQEETA